MIGTTINSGYIGLGITLSSGYTLTNTSTGTITNTAAAVVGLGGGLPNTILNQGSVASGGDAGITLRSGGSITNQTSASILGVIGIGISGSVGTVVNYGGITAAGSGALSEAGAGIALYAGGSVTNSMHSGQIIGTNAGILAQGGPAQISNLSLSTISGGTGFGVDLTAGGTVLNASARISGYGGVEISGGAGTIVSLNGTIVASGSKAIALASGYANLVSIVGGSFFGTVDGGNTVGSGIESTLAFANADAVTGLGSKYVNFAQIRIDPTAQVDTYGANTVAAGVTLTDMSTLSVGGAVSSTDGSLYSAGLIDLIAGTLQAATLAGNGTIDMGTGPNLIMLGVSCSETISGLGFGDFIDLLNLGFVSGATAVVSGGTLTATSNGVIETLPVSGIANGTTFFVDRGRSSVGTEIVACFAAGTRIGTADGPMPVERLSAGDQVVTADGRREPIVWIGQRTVDCRGRRSLWPVRISAGAFGPGAPIRDLFLSPDHAVSVNGVLVPVKLLVNGTTVTPVKRNRVRYYHVELPRHEVILAEGMPAESYLDDGRRADFECDREAARRLSDFAPGFGPHAAWLWETRGAAPLVTVGAKLAAARAAVASAVKSF